MFCTDATISLCLANRRVCPELVRRHIPPPTVSALCDAPREAARAQAQPRNELASLCCVKGTCRIHKNVWKGFSWVSLGWGVKRKKVFAIFSDSGQATHKYIETSQYCNYLLVENVFSTVYFKMVNLMLSLFYHNLKKVFSRCFLTCWVFFFFNLKSEFL